MSTSTDGPNSPIASGAIASSNLEIVQSSFGELYIIGQTQMSLTFARESSSELLIGAISDALFVPSPVMTYTIISNVTLEINTIPGVVIELDVNSLGSLTLAGTTSVEITDAIDTEIASTFGLTLAGTTSVVITDAIDSEIASTFGLTLAGTTSVVIVEPKTTQISSIGALEIAASVGISLVTIQTSTGELQLAGSSIIREGNVNEIDSRAELNIDATTETQVIQTANSTGALVITGTTDLALVILVDVEFESNVELILYATTAYPGLFHQGSRELKTATELRVARRKRRDAQPRQIAFLSRVYTKKIRANAQVGFYPAPPEVIIPIPRPQGPFSKFLDQFGNNLTYNYNSNTGTATFGVSSTVEFDTSASKDIQIRSEDALLLGLDDDSMLLDSSNAWGLIEDQMDENQRRGRQLQEDKDLLGITD